MRLLLDTHTFLWAVHKDGRISSTATQYFLGEHELFFSAASYWEIVIKFRKGKLQLESHPSQFVHHYLDINNITRLPVIFQHVDVLDKMPLHHRDPFDRLLVAQSIAENMPILSADEHLKKYGVEVLW